MCLFVWTQKVLLWLQLCLFSNLKMLLLFAMAVSLTLQKANNSMQTRENQTLEKMLCRIEQIYVKCQILHHKFGSGPQHLNSKTPWYPVYCMQFFYWSPSDCVCKQALHLSKPYTALDAACSSSSAVSSLMFILAQVEAVPVSRGKVHLHLSTWHTGSQRERGKVGADHCWPHTGNIRTTDPRKGQKKELHSYWRGISGEMV